MGYSARVVLCVVGGATESGVKLFESQCADQFDYSRSEILTLGGRIK
jgi:hypothetical protein